VNQLRDGIQKQPPTEIPVSAPHNSPDDTAHTLDDTAHTLDDTAHALDDVDEDVTSGNTTEPVVSS